MCVLKGKSTKTAATRAALSTPICTKSFVGCGFAPKPTGGAYSAPQAPLLCLGDLLLKEEDDERRWEGEVRGGSSSFARTAVGTEFLSPYPSHTHR